MKYVDFILENLKKTSLKHIRIKVDPALVSKEADFSKIDGYEGYVLEEGKGHLKILVLSPEMSVEDLPVEIIQFIADEADYDSFCLFKEFLIKTLMKDGYADNDPILTQIQSSNCLNNIEVLIKQYGYSGDRLAEIYKKFLTDDES
jgi:hypothetical protein